MTDINSALFQLPEDTTAQLYQIVDANVIADMTTGVVGGTGAFDLIMASVKAHLQLEYENGRITGSEYTKAYIEMAQAALQTALQFVMGSSASYWQAQNAQIQAITGRIAMESARYNYTNTQPAQLSLLKEQANVQHAQISDTLPDGITPITGVMGKQKALYAQQIVSYQRDAECKAAKIFTDAWITQKTLDSGLLPPTGFTNDSTNEVLTVIMANNGFGSPVA